jgi:hypothetical protein
MIASEELDRFRFTESMQDPHWGAGMTAKSTTFDRTRPVLSNSSMVGQIGGEDSRQSGHCPGPGFSFHFQKSKIYDIVDFVAPF